MDSQRATLHRRSFPNASISRRWWMGSAARSRRAGRWKTRSTKSLPRKSLVGCCGTRFIRTMSSAPTRNSSGTENVRRRTFLQLSGAFAGAGILPRICAGGPRVELNAKVVIAGGGFAGASCALWLRHLNASVDVTLVDPDERYVTCPMSNGVLVGLRDLKSISVSRRGLERAGVRYVRDKLVSIDPRLRHARLAGGSALAYDRMVVAPGIRFLWGRPQGYD